MAKGRDNITSTKRIDFGEGDIAKLASPIQHAYGRTEERVAFRKAMRHFATLLLLAVGLVDFAPMPSPAQAPRPVPVGVSYENSHAAAKRIAAGIIAYYGSHGRGDPNFVLEQLPGMVDLIWTVHVGQEAPSKRGFGGTYSIAVLTQAGFAGLPDANQVDSVTISMDGTDDKGGHKGLFFLNISERDGLDTIAAYAASPAGGSVFYSNTSGEAGPGILGSPANIYATAMPAGGLPQVEAWADEIIKRAETGAPVGYLGGIPDVSVD